MSVIKRVIITGLCAALCVVLPIAFHAVPNAGAVFLPMHIPVLLCGLICGWPFGLVCGLIGPFLSNLMTGMPPAAMMPSMLVELAVYGMVAGVVISLVRLGNLYRDLYVSLAGAMLVGRVAAGLARAFIFMAGKYSMTAWVTAYLVTGLPGIVIQLVLIPSLIVALERAKAIPRRY